jgi:uncharacterized protein (TIGR04255 family)
LVVETTRYGQFERLRDLLVWALDARLSVGPLDGLERVGLRYIDEIRVPDSNGAATRAGDTAEADTGPAWEQWIAVSLLGPAPLGADMGLRAVQWQGLTVFGPAESGLAAGPAATSGGGVGTQGGTDSLVLRYGPAEGYALDPGGDLKRAVPPPGPFFLLDVDSFWTSGSEVPSMDRDELVRIASRLHAPVRTLFEALSPIVYERRSCAMPADTDGTTTRLTTRPTARAQSNATETGTRTSATSAPAVDETQLSASLVTERAGAVRGHAGQLTSDTVELHRDTTFHEWTTRTAARGKNAPTELLAELAELGFAWRDVARMVGVSVAAVQKWRRGERITGDNRRRVAGLLAACDMVAEHYFVSEVASWFEMPLVPDAPLTPIDLYAAERSDLVFDYASGHSEPGAVLAVFDPDWRARFRSDYEVFTAADGQRSLRPKGG